jgi:hypothetical protein
VGRPFGSGVFTDFTLPGKPQGYDAKCETCGQWFTYGNARACHANAWRRFCCDDCEQRAYGVAPCPHCGAIEANGEAHGPACTRGVNACAAPQQEKDHGR